MKRRKFIQSSSLAGLSVISDNSFVNENPILRVPDQAEFRKAIYHERRVELAFEGHQYHDLVRTGRLLEVMRKFYFGSNVKDYQILFPIPQSEIDINPNKIWQNPGFAE